MACELTLPPAIAFVWINIRYAGWSIFRFRSFSLSINAHAQIDKLSAICNTLTHTITIAAAVPTLRLPTIPQALPELSTPPPLQQAHQRDLSLKLDQQSSQLRIGESTEVECYSSDSSYTDVVWERADGSPLPPNIQVRYWIIVFSPLYSHLCFLLPILANRQSAGHLACVCIRRRWLPLQM